MKEEESKETSINNYCETSHIINEHIKSKKTSPYKKLQKCLFYESACLENKIYFSYENWNLKE